MLAWLKDIVRPVRRNDPLFGHMQFLRNGALWGGSAPFPATGARVNVTLPGSLAGPTSEQRAFFGDVEAHYPALWTKVELELRRALADDPSIPKDVRFILKGIDLPADLGPEPVWELVYETEPPSWFLVVEMRGWQPVDVSVEC